MGQKVNPHGLRVGVIKDWDSRWYASDEKVGDLIVEDQKIRKFLKKTLYGAGVPKIEIERSADTVTIFLQCARPGVVIGKGGEQIEQYRLAVEKLIGKKVKLNIVEVRNPDMNAQLVAENIAAQLEKRIGFRLAQKDVFVNIAGGIRTTDMAMDLSVVAAVVSSNTDTPLPAGWCLCGEVGLSGEVRPVSRIEQRIAEAAKLGFTDIILPYNNAVNINTKAYRINIHPAKNVNDALRKLLG